MWFIIKVTHKKTAHKKYCARVFARLRLFLAFGNQYSRVLSTMVHCQSWCPTILICRQPIIMYGPWCFQCGDNSYPLCTSKSSYNHVHNIWDKRKKWLPQDWFCKIPLSPSVQSLLWKLMVESWQEWVSGLSSEDLSRVGLFLSYLMHVTRVKDNASTGLLLWNWANNLSNSWRKA